jgi:hypothetical protein
MGVLTPPSLGDLDVSDGTFACPDLTTFACLDELGLVVFAVTFADRMPAA